MKRKTIWMLILTLFVSSISYAGNDIFISFEQLPPLSQEFIKKHFGDKKIALSKMERDVFKISYDVILTNGDKLEFNSKGEWMQIECKYSFVPIEIIPVQILNYVQTNYPSAKILEIEKKRTYYEIQLSNKLEIKFNKAFQVIEIDS